MNSLCRIVLLALLATASGCVYGTGPSNNLPFNDSGDLESLEGVYQNIGETEARTTTPYYLSAIIWPGVKGLDHSAINAIEVRKTGEKALTVKALEDGKVIKESVFAEGSDFTFKAGRIHLRKEVVLADPVLGPGYAATELGIDTGRHGKYRDKGGFAGLAFLVIPVAVYGTDDVRFVRLSK